MAKKIELIKIGSISHQEVVNLCQVYIQRLKPYFNIESTIFKNEKQFEQSKIFSTNNWIALDEHGILLDSKKFAKNLEKNMASSGNKSLAFVIGDSYGFSENIIAQAKQKIALSSLTLNGNHAWLLLCEQIYRASCIIKGHPYHH